MGKPYAARRGCLITCLIGAFGELLKYYGDEAGLHLLVELDSSADEELLAETALKYGTRIYPASAYFISHKPAGPVFLLGYSNLGENQIRRGVESMAKAEAEIRLLVPNE
ncbi:hypothetical protein J7E73_17540 [Paenibacillus albidus]|uniref:hypothetical protein n=1 Tax=Paenibacillus albidus TaxID=2041023 RepID=UPI001BED1F9E|nr:hypothetical protein [Paenibacillus albidus]MBT2290905.1 hypothetical protein [Paenibacillus albidus]